VALNASEQALLGELAVVEAPRVRQLGLYETHSDAFIERFGEQARLGGNDEARPWEASALGRPVHEQSPAPYVRARSYTSISATHERAAEFAEKANEQAMEGYRAKNYQLCYDAASEAIRLNPTKVVYLGNRAAAALKLRGQAHLRQAVEDCTRACALDPSYVKGYVRSAGAHLAMGEPHTVQLAIELYERARQLDPTDRSIEHALENARMLYASDYAR
jgi:tetratricopeptide (TPR) repeat protein